MICTLHEALTWVAFGAFNVPFAELNKNQETLDKAKQLLRRAFIAGRVHIGSGTEVLHATENIALDWDANSIALCSYPGQYISEQMLIKNIQVITEDLKREFPHAVHERQQPIEEDSIKRPGACILHDVAYYLWEKEQNLSAKEIYHIVNAVMGTYPRYKDRTVVQLSSVEKWLTGFRNGTYKPANEKHILIKQFPGLFDKMRKAHR